MSHTDFCHFILNSPQSTHIRNLTACCLSWWQSKIGKLRHQYLVLTVAHRPHPGPYTFYDLRIERAGKGMGFRGTAEQRVTITRAQPLKHYSNLHNTLLLALVGTIESSSTDNEENATDSYLRFNDGSIGYIRWDHYGAVHCFQNPLDHRYRGPPLTLHHLASYILAIVQFAPRYSLASTNCYFFARVLTHVISVRHYSFKYLALGPQGTRRSEITIHKLFEALRQEEKSNGVLLYWKFQGLVDFLLVMTIPPVILLGAINLFESGRAWEIVCGFLLLGVGPFLGLHVVAVLSVMGAFALVSPFQIFIRSDTKAIVSCLGE